MSKDTNKKNTLLDNKVLVIIITVVITLALVWTLVLFLNKSSKDDSKPVSPSANSTQVEKIEKSVSGGTADEDRKAASEAVTLLLQSAHISPNGIDPLARIEALDTGDFTVVDPSLKDMVRFPASSTDGIKISTFQSLVTMATVLENQTGKSDFAMISDEAWRSSYPDTELGSVFVPLNIFTGGGSSFSLEMVFIDGEWKLAPYSLIEAVRISSMLQEGQPQPNPSPTES